MPALVSLVRSSNHYEGVASSLNLLQNELRLALENVSQIVLKVNFVVTRVELALTPLDAVKSFIDFISPFYNGAIIIAESATWGNTKDAFDKNGYTKLAEDNPQVSLLDLRDDEIVEKQIAYPDGNVTVPLSKTMMEAPFLVSITRPKTHVNAVVTLGLKNVLVGAIQRENVKGASTWSTRNKIHREKSRYIHDFLLSLANHITPHFTIIDGTIGMEGNGPVKGTEIKSGWVVSSTDVLAADSIGTYLMGFDLKHVPYLAELRGRDCGCLYPLDEISIVGVDPEELVHPFEPHRVFKHLRTHKTFR
jgi:uncharacterized protein (DUF362 family)